MPSFEDFANFRTEIPNPIIPIEGATNALEGDAHHGAYSTVVDLDEHHALKITRLLNRDSDKNLKFQGRDAIETLVPHSPDPKTDREQVMERTTELAKDRKEAYLTIRSYMGSYVPELLGTIVAESPRKTIEEKYLRSRFKVADPAILETVPTHEVSIIELWDRIDGKQEIGKRGHEEYTEMLHDPLFMKELADFAEKALKLVEEKHVMLDICDGAGIEYKLPSGVNARAKSLDETLAFLEADAMENQPIPRNAVFQEGKLIFYDTFPFDTVSGKIEPDFISKAKTAISENNLEGLWLLVGDTDDNSPRLHTVRYLTLLYKLGAEF